MFVVYKTYEKSGEIIINQYSIVGIYDGFDKAKRDVTDFFYRCKYEYSIDLEYADYLFIRCYGKNGIELENNIYFEISQKNLTLNELSL